MDRMKIHPELRKAARFLPPLPIHRYWLLKTMRFVLPKVMGERPVPRGIAVRDLHVGNHRVRIYKPEGKLSGAGVLWIHGGGFVMGDVTQDNRICSLYSAELNAVVLSTDYGLGPENPFPEGLSDCFESWRWFLEHAGDLGVDPARIAIAGQSGGGGMAASLAQRILDYGGTQPAAQFLFCPMLDDRTAARTELDALRHVMWPNRNNRAAWSWYLGCEAGGGAVPENAVPARREDLAGLPPTWIGIGDLDLFYEECKIYAERLKQAGVPTKIDEVSQAFHGFESLVPESELANSFFGRHFRYARTILGVEPALAAPIHESTSRGWQE